MAATGKPVQNSAYEPFHIAGRSGHAGATRPFFTQWEPQSLRCSSCNHESLGIFHSSLPSRYPPRINQPLTSLAMGKTPVFGTPTLNVARGRNSRRSAPTMGDRKCRDIPNRARQGKGALNPKNRSVISTRKSNTLPGPSRKAKEGQEFLNGIEHLQHGSVHDRRCAADPD